MSDDRSAIIKSTLDATGVRKGADEVKATVRDLSRTVEGEGRKAAEGVEGIGDGAKRGADGLNRETGRMIASIQRAQAAALAGGRQTADYFEALGKQRGLSAEVLQPYLEGLRAAEAAQKAATGSLGTMGVSARQTAAALRGVPAQFTDIITSLQGGQAPLTVFLQQGGQLKDMFGGAGAAAQALGGYVLSLINPFTVLAAVAGVVTVGFIQGSKESQEYARALILSGNAAGVTAQQLQAIAAAIDATSGATESKAAEVLTQLAAAGEVGAANLERFARAAIELERAGGPAAEETAKAFAQLARDPLAASIKLTESVRYLTAATAEQIAELERQGKTTEAARVAQEAYFDAVTERTPRMVDQLGLIERAWLGIKDAIKSTGSAVLDIGRPVDLVQREIDALRGRLATNAAERPNATDYGKERIDQGNKLLGARIRLLQQGQAYEALDAFYAGQRVEREEAGVRWLKEGEKYLSSKQRLEADIARIKTEGAKAGISEAVIAERVAAARERSSGKADAGAAREQARALEQQLRLVAELSGVSGTYLEDLRRLDGARRTGLVGEERYVELVTELISKQPMVRDQMQDMARAAKAQAAAVLQADEANSRYLAGLDQNIDAGGRTLQQLQLELVELVAGKQARFELEQQERERLAITYEQSAAAAELDRTDGSRYRKLAGQVREEIRLRKQVNEATASNEVKRSNEKAAQDAARDWERTADQISQSLADAIFNGGKNAGDLIKGYFRTLVLKPVIEAQLRPLANALGAVLGIPGAGGLGAAAAGGQSGGPLGDILGKLGIAKLASSVGGLISQFSTLATVFTTGNLIGKAISGGYSIGGKIGDNLGGLIGGVPGGVINRLFGRKLKDAGFEGSFGAEGDFSGNGFQFLKGGLFRSDKTKRGPLDEQLAQVLDAGGAAAFAQAQAYAEVLGLPAEAMANYTQKVKVSLKGLSEEQAQAAVEKAVQDYQEGLLGRFSTQLQPLRRVGETLSEVAGRVAELTVFTRGINELGGVFNRVANLSIDAREQLIGFAGGMEALNSQALAFAQNYYSRDEIAGVKAREIQGVLSAAGISQDVATREQFRALVEGADVSTAAGREQLAQLLRIAGDFATVADYLAETGTTLAGAASLAPTTGALAEIFSQPQTAQVEAINNVVTAVQKVDDSINRMAEMLLDLQRWQLEVGGA